MNRYIAIILLAVFALGLTPRLAAAQETYRVVVHPDNPTVSISKKKLSQLLLKESSRWDGELSVMPIDLDSKSQVRDDFSRDVHGRSVTSIKNYWQRQIFSGGRVPPPEVSNDAAVIDYVKTHPGAVGYVSASAKIDGVKVLTLASK